MATGKLQPIIDKHVEELRGYSLFDPLALDGEQLAIWWQFLATDETVKACDEFRVRGSDKKVGEDVNPDDGIVRSLAKFAVDTFNKSYKLHVDGNTDAAMALTKCVECYYYKLTDNYYFYMKLEATSEKEQPGVYEVVVRCESADGSRTLTKFCFDREELDKILDALFPPEPDTDEDVPSTDSDTDEDVLSTESDTEEDVPLNRKEFYEASGMVAREWFFGKGFSGHDFYNPFSKDRCIRFDGAKPEKMM
ncbi:hypothetical protein CTI12_AA368600 [Artemisia annua]|uniref:Uncharacterized protein n=1 Tax=Artemisia annua TaxID=35608 RepID=A0A2U1LN90_ARTAN|nr:hypothetical protein CTI12_AA368600 [Artemisia annua]